MNVKIHPERYLKYLYLPKLFGTERTKEILTVNPTIEAYRTEPEIVKYYVFDFDEDHLEEMQLSKAEDCFKYKQNHKTSWINVDGIRKSDIEIVCNHFNIHALIQEDILSVGQRPKIDEVEGVMYCLLNMLFYNEQKKTIETEQISLVLGEDFVISFQEDASRDVFDTLRMKLKNPKSQLRQRTIDYTLYTMLDLIVDHYFLVMEKLGLEIEYVEEDVVRNSNKRSLARINQIRKELIVLKRNIVPVRDLVSGMIKSESELLNDRTTKYFKDVYDHIMQAQDLTENYRDMMVSMQDLYINNVNLKMNEVMKVMAIVTSILAPATVIGGIFGMNFDIIPFAHHSNGFYLAVTAMFIIPVWMLWAFKKRGWF